MRKILQKKSKKRKFDYRNTLFVGIILAFVGCVFSYYMFEYKTKKNEGSIISSQLNTANELLDKGMNEEAAMRYNDLLEKISEKKNPRTYAQVQGNLGNAYKGLSEVRDKEVNLIKAITARQESLKVYTPENYPADYATSQNNLGNAYCGLSEVRDKEVNLIKAITAHQEALRVWTLEKYPVEYATSQNNLGNAYWGLSEVRDRKKNMEKAIVAYMEALKIFTVKEYPELYGGVMSNLKKGDRKNLRF